MRTITTALAAIMVLAFVSPTGARPPRPDGRELLAEHETLAVLESVAFRQCRGRTAACPKDCGDSGEFATFKIVEYTHYKQHGKYGGKQKSYHIQVSDFHRKPKGDPKILEAVRGLKEGDYVRLHWRHDYVTKNRSSFPERPIVKLEKISKAEAKAILAKDAAGKGE